jgi:hypothetical protein
MTLRPIPRPDILRNNDILSPGQSVLFLVLVGKRSERDGKIEWNDRKLVISGFFIKDEWHKLFI